MGASDGAGKEKYDGWDDTGGSYEDDTCVFDSAAGADARDCTAASPETATPVARRAWPGPTGPKWGCQVL